MCVCVLVCVCVAHVMYRGLLRGLMLLRTREQVHGQLGLPPCVRQDVLVTMGPKQRKLHAKMAADFRKSLTDLQESPQYSWRLSTAKTSLTALRQACCHAKLASKVVMPPQRTSLRETLHRLVTEVGEILPRDACRTTPATFCILIAQ